MLSLVMYSTEGAEPWTRRIVLGSCCAGVWHHSISKTPSRFQGVHAEKHKATLDSQALHVAYVKNRRAMRIS